MSEYKRPAGASGDPEACYRAGYQHGAYAILRRIEKKLLAADRKQLLDWIEIDLQRWRHDRHSEPQPPAV